MAFQTGVDLCRIFRVGLAGAVGVHRKLGRLQLRLANGLGQRLLRGGDQICVKRARHREDPGRESLFRECCSGPVDVGFGPRDDGLRGRIVVGHRQAWERLQGGQYLRPVGLYSRHAARGAGGRSLSHDAAAQR